MWSVDMMSTLTGCAAGMGVLCREGMVRWAQWSPVKYWSAKLPVLCAFRQGGLESVFDQGYGQAGRDTAVRSVGGGVMGWLAQSVVGTASKTGAKQNV
jgi:hypothetical protein